jgi:hypothetical protein
MGVPTALVLDEHLLGVRVGLEHRGIVVRTVEDFRAKSTLDPDVIRAVGRGMRKAPWILVTMDGTIVKEHPSFDWDRYAIAWVLIDPRARGVAAEQSKNEVLHRHARAMLAQVPGCHHTYTEARHYKHPPSLITQSRRARPFG